MPVDTTWTRSETPNRQGREKAKDLTLKKRGEGVGEFGDRN